MNFRMIKLDGEIAELMSLFSQIFTVYSKNSILIFIMFHCLVKKFDIIFIMFQWYNYNYAKPSVHPLQYQPPSWPCRGEPNILSNIPAENTVYV